eukprot:g740.t1
MPDISTSAFIGYTGLAGLAFLVMPEMQTLDIWPAAKGDATAMEVGTIYCEVIGAFSLMLSVNTCPGAMGYFLSALCWCGVMTKHMFVNELTPPPPVIAMGFGVLALTAYSALFKSNIGRYAFLAVAALNAAIFFADPKTPLLDSWPNLTEGSVAMTIGLRSMEVIGTHFTAFLLLGCPGALGRAMAMTSLIALISYHRVAHDIGPPVPVMLLMSISFILQWNAYFSGSKSADKKGDKQM